MTRFVFTLVIVFLLSRVCQGQVPNGQSYPTAVSGVVRTVPAAYSIGYNPSYVRVWSAEKPITSDTAFMSSSRTTAEVKQTTTYSDGLGRPFQIVTKGISPLGYDFVQPFLYDSFGRNAIQYLPYVSPSNDGNLKTGAFIEQATFESQMYNPTGNSNGEKFFYRQTDMEASPLNRPLKQYPEGNSWIGNGVGISVQYQVNDATDSVIVWNSPSAGATPVKLGYYAAGTLYKQAATNENGFTTLEYKDIRGRKILTKTQLATGAGLYSGHSGWNCTYNIYDDIGQLLYIIQPKGTAWLSSNNWTFDATLWKNSSIAKELTFNYEYDQLGRLVVKRIPGSGETWMVYDARDRLVMTQDSLLRAQGTWLYTSYDSLNRETVTGIWITSGDRLFHQNLASASVIYPNPAGSYTVLSQKYYDNYAWVSSSGSGLSSSLITSYTTDVNYFYSASNMSFPYPQAISCTLVPTTKLTGEKVNIIGTSTYLYRVNFYDDNGRPVQTQSTNFTGGQDTVTSQYSFTGKLLRSLVAHGKSGNNPQRYIVLGKRFYDAGGRIIAITKKVGNSFEDTIATYRYNELGIIQLKKVGQQRVGLANFSYSSNPIDTLRYSYNIRGWLTGINKDYANSVNGAQNWFGMEVDYDFGFTANQLNGNISGIKWRNNEDGLQRAYGFNYDPVNRLTKANFTQNAGTNVWDVSAGVDFSASGISYDQNGNILALNHKGLKVNKSYTIDSLSYGYNNNTNRLNYITDLQNDTSAHLGDFTEIINNATQDYWYDANGNMYKDNNKGLSNIHYNFLNLPDSITTTSKGYIKYVYSADGGKLQKIVSDTSAHAIKVTRTDYVGSFNYLNDTLQFITQEEGRIRPKTVNKSDTMFYDFAIRDYLGNTRVLLTDEKAQNIYPVATVENNASSMAVLKNYYSINVSDTIGVARIASWGATVNNGYANNNGNPPYNTDPYVNTTATSTVVYKLNGATGDKTGLGITLKVTAGDVIDIYGKSFWHSNGTTSNSYPISAALTNFISAFTGTSAVSAGAHGSVSAISSAINTTTADVNSLKYLLDTTKSAIGALPKASLNWILFDMQFNPVKTSSGFDLVRGADTVKSHHSTVTIPKGGYLYVYCSNESNQDVFFDNFQVIHTRGMFLESSDYYPGGLAMTGICDKAMKSNYAENKYMFNGGNELQNKEFIDGSGLELYDAIHRMYDPQISRFGQIDGLAQMSSGLSPYVFGSDNPVLRNDPLGLKDTVVNGESVHRDADLQAVTVSAAKPGSVTYGLNNANFGQVDAWVGFMMSKGHSAIQINKWALSNNLLKDDRRKWILNGTTSGSVKYRADISRAWKIEGEIYKIFLVTMLTQGVSELGEMLYEGEEMALAENGYPKQNISNFNEELGMAEKGKGMSFEETADATRDFADKINEGFVERLKESGKVTKEGLEYYSRRMQEFISKNQTGGGHSDILVQQARLNTLNKILDLW